VAELFGNFQFEIYMQGLSGSKPPFPMAYRDLEAKAKEVLRPDLTVALAGYTRVTDIGPNALERVERLG
jgi:lactate 2-monooxygenase